MNWINYHRSLWVITVLAVVFTVVAAIDVEAQENVQMVRTLVIKDNQILIDGREVGSDQLPATVQLEGISVSYSFIGIDVPVVQIGGQLFAVLQDRLQPIESDEQETTAFRQDGRQLQSGQEANGWIVDSDRGQYYTFQGERLRTDEAVPRLLNEANALYLGDLQQQNQALFARLTQERELENQADFLTIAARRAQSREEWETHRKALTEKLTAIFEMKQRNRRDEIAQFETELELLRRRVEKREELKEQIVDQRVDQLIGSER